MITYYSYQQIKEMMGLKTGFDCDLFSRTLAANFIQTFATNVAPNSFVFTKGKHCSDLIYTTTDGAKVAVEAKDRNCFSYSYGDHMINDDKWRSIVYRQNNGEFLTASLYSFYNDGVIRVTTNITSETKFTVEEHWQNDQTMLDPANTKKVLKKCMHYKTDQDWFFCIGWDPEQNKWQVKWSPVKLSPDELNKEQYMIVKRSYQLF